MNLVGPKALPPSAHVHPRAQRHLHQFAGYYTRLTVRPGLTGLAQIYAPGDIDVGKQIKYDALYACRTNIWLDLRLLILSLFLTVTGRWLRGRRASLASRIARMRSGRD